MKLVFPSILIFLFSFEISSATQIDSLPFFHHSIGISVSSISGIGLSYRYSLENEFCIKGIGAALPTENNDSRTSFVTFIGFELQYNAIHTSNSRLYGFIGTSYWYSKTRYTYSNNLSTSISYDIYKTTSFGAGFGFEGSLTDRFTINFDIGFQSILRSQTEIPSSTNYYNYPFSRIGIGGGFGLGYQF